MPRIRTIKPEFFRHEELQDLEKANPGAYVMLVFAGIWTQCDKDGRFEWKPRTLKLDLLPFLDFDMEATLTVLSGGGFIRRYVVAGKVFGVIATWEKHQRITGKEATDGGKYPEPPKNSPEIPKASTENHEGNTGETTGKHPGAQEMEKERKRNNPPKPPRAGGDAGRQDEKPKAKRERKPRTTLKTFADTCKQAGVGVVSEYRGLQEYVEATGLPSDFVQLAWEVFKAQFLPGGTHENRQQADWRRHFLNYVRNNYFRLWYAKPGGGDTPEYALSTSGMQAQAEIAARGRRHGHA